MLKQPSKLKDFVVLKPRVVTQWQPRKGFTNAMTTTFTYINIMY